MFFVYNKIDWPCIIKHISCRFGSSNMFDEITKEEVHQPMDLECSVEFMCQSDGRRKFGSDVQNVPWTNKSVWLWRWKDHQNGDELGIWGEEINPMHCSCLFAAPNPCSYLLQHVCVGSTKIVSGVPKWVLHLNIVYKLCTRSSWWFCPKTARHLSSSITH